MMRMWRAYGWLVVLVVMFAAGCSQREQEDVGQTEEGRLVSGSTAVVERVTRSVAPGDRLLVLSGFNGEVQLEGTDEEVAQLVFEKRARGADDEAAREVLEGIELVEQGDATRYEYVMRSGQPSQSRVNVRGTVPHDTQLHVDFESGAVALSNVEGPIEIEHESGNVDVAGAAAGVFVNIRNGGIDVGLDRLPGDASVELLTSNGDLALTVPADASAQITAQTEAGDIRVDGLRFARRQLAPRDAGARLEARLGTGSASVVLSTENGSIVLAGTPGTTPAPVDTGAAAPPDTVQRDTAGASPSVTPPDTLQRSAPTDTSASTADTTRP